MRTWNFIHGALLGVALPVSLVASPCDSYLLVAKPQLANERRTADQRIWGFGNQAVAINGSDESILVFGSWLADGSEHGIVARRLDSEGLPIGGDFNVNQHTAGDQALPGVGANAAGQFVITWSGDGPGDSRGAYARFYNTDGNPVSGDVQVHDSTSDVQKQCRPLVFPDGRALITWTDEDFSGGAVLYRIYDAQGNPLTGELTAHVSPIGNQKDQDAELLPDGGFVIVWNQSNQSVRLRYFDADGSPSSDEIVIATGSEINIPTVAADGEGNVMVNWHEDVSGGTEVHASLLNTDREFEVLEFNLPANPNQNQNYAFVKGHPDGGFVAVWQKGAGGNRSTDIQVRGFTSDGTPCGPEQTLALSPDNTEEFPSMEISADGQITYAWVEDFNATGRDIYFQRANVSALLALDEDLDGIPTGEEYDLGTDPFVKDTDGDTVEDGVEVAIGSDPLDPADPQDVTDSDGDRLPDFADDAPETIDQDGDGNSDGWEAASGTDEDNAEDHPSLGDVNGDGPREFVDAVLVFQVFLGNIPIQDRAQLIRMDVNRDGIVDPVDAVLLFNYYLDVITVLP